MKIDNRVLVGVILIAAGLCLTATMGTVYGKQVVQSPVTKSVSYTPNSLTVCENGRCTAEISSGIEYVKEDGVWKDVEDARSLKGSGIECVVKSDGEHFAECLDWNYTSVTLSLKSDKDAPLKVLKVDSEKSKENKIEYNLKSEKNVKASSKSVLETVKIDFGDVIHYGETSTTITWQTPEADLRIAIRTGNPVFGFLNKFDVSYIAGYYVDSAYWCGKIYSTQGPVPAGGEVQIWRMNSQTWSESSDLETINAISYTDSTIDTLNSTTGGTYGCVDVTDIVRADVSDSNTYSSLRLESNGYPVGTPSEVSSNAHNQIGFSDGVSYHRISFHSTEYPPASKLIIEYSLEPLIILSPTNTTYASDYVWVNGTTRVESDVTYSFNSGSNHTSNTSSTSFATLTNEDVLECANVIRVYAEYAGGAANQTIFFTSDTIAPLVTVEPYTKTYRTNASGVIPINFTVSDSCSGVSSCSVNFGGSNFTLGGCTNDTIAGGNIISAGEWTATVYSQDTAGNTGSDSESFYYYPLLEFHLIEDLNNTHINSYQMYVTETDTMYTTANGTLKIPIEEIGFGSRNFRFTAGGYGTETYTETIGATTWLNKTFSVTPASTHINVFDEADMAIGVDTQISFNVTLSNSTVSNTWYDQYDFFELVNETAIGTVTMTLSSYGYETRTYSIPIDSSTVNDITAYLLRTADAFFVRFHATTTSEVPIQNANILAERFLNSTWQTVGEGKTDESGVYGIFLYPTASYRVTASATGYESQIRTITPSSNDYTFLLSGTSNDTFHTMLEDISYYFIPTDPNIETNVSVEFTFNVTCTNQSLTSYGMSIYHNNTILVYSDTVAGAGLEGGNVTYHLNTSYTAGNFTAVITFTKDGYDTWTSSKYFTIRNWHGSGFSLWDFLTYFQGSAVPSMFKHLVALMCAFGAAGLASTAFQRGGGILAIIILSAFTLFGWFSWELMLLTGMSIAAILILKEGI